MSSSVSTSTVHLLLQQAQFIATRHLLLQQAQFIATRHLLLQQAQFIAARNLLLQQAQFIATRHLLLQQAQFIAARHLLLQQAPSSWSLHHPFKLELANEAIVTQILSSMWGNGKKGAVSASRELKDKLHPSMECLLLFQQAQFLFCCNKHSSLQQGIPKVLSIMYGLFSSDFCTTAIHAIVAIRNQQS
jgi:hypothetical protein